MHDETRSGDILPTWVSADEVATARELFSYIRQEGYNVSYYRTPVARDQSPNDGYLDTYTSLLASIPTSTSLVFNCGAGVVRSTFAMSVALIVRRKQLVDQGLPDPYGPVLEEGAFPVHEAPNQGAAKVLKAQSEQAARDQSLLRLMHVLSKCARRLYPLLGPILLESRSMSDDFIGYRSTAYQPDNCVDSAELAISPPREPEVIRRLRSFRRLSSFLTSFYR